jgi:hypothetical protein
VALDPELEAWLGAVVAIAVLVWLIVAFGLVPNSTPPYSGTVPTSTDWDLGEGMLAVSNAQNVSGTSAWDGYCSTPSNACIAPVGVAYLAPTGELAVTERESAPNPHTSASSENGIEIFDPTTLAPVGVTLLSCQPEVPFYPGSGPTFYVPCLNATTYASGPLLFVDVTTGAVFANVSLPFETESMAYDTMNGILYLAGGNHQLAAVDPGTRSLGAIVNVSQAAFYPSSDIVDSATTLVFDPAIDALIAPSVAGGLLEISPGSGAVGTTVPVPGAVATLALDASSSQLLVSTLEGNSSWVSVLDARSLGTVARLGVPPCLEGCSGAWPLAPLVVDPTHGDAYVVGDGGLFTLNLSALQLVGGFGFDQDGLVVSAAYVPSTDRIFATFLPGLIGVGSMIQLDHQNGPVVSRLLWLPPTAGSLALAVAAGIVVAVPLGGLRRRPPAPEARSPERPP